MSKIPKRWQNNQVPQTQQVKAQQALQKLNATSPTIPGTLYSSYQYPPVTSNPISINSYLPIDLSTPEAELAALERIILQSNGTTYVSFTGSPPSPYQITPEALAYLTQRREVVRQEVITAQEKERLKTAMVETAVAGESLRDRVLDLIGAMEEEDASL